MFAFLTQRLENEANLSTGEAIVALEQRFRAERIGTYCVARNTKDPYRSCNYHKEPTPFHLYLVVDEKVKAKQEWRKQGCRTRTENLQRLLRCGFLENATEAATKERRMNAVKLPFDLKPLEGETAVRLFDSNSIAYHVQEASETVQVRNKCLQHASAARRGVLSEALSFTGVQVARTSVLVQQWPQTRIALEKQMRERLPIAESAKAEKYKCIREQLIPIGYQLLGVTREPPHVADDSVDGRRYALFDMYAVTERKYHVSFNDMEYAWYQKAKAAASIEQDEAYLRALLAEKTGVEDASEMNGLNFSNVHRHVHLMDRGPKPL